MFEQVQEKFKDRVKTLEEELAQANITSAEDNRALGDAQKIVN